MLSTDKTKVSIQSAVEMYLENISRARSANTARTYKNALNVFLSVLRDEISEPDKLDISELTEEAVIWFARYLKQYSPTTERLYLTALNGFFEYLELPDVRGRSGRCLCPAEPAGAGKWAPLGCLA